MTEITDLSAEVAAIEDGKEAWRMLCQRLGHLGYRGISMAQQSRIIWEERRMVRKTEREILTNLIRAQDIYKRA